MRACAGAGLVLAVAVLATATAAWACLPQPYIVVQPRSSGPAGSEIVVEGARFGEGPIEVRWNGLDGPQLASATGPDFTVTAAIPSDPPGLYTLLVVSRASDGGVDSVQRAVFDITAEGGDPATDVGSGTEPGAAAAGAAADPEGPAQPGPSGYDTGVQAAAGVGLLALGAVLGAGLSRRRRGA